MSQSREIASFESLESRRLLSATISADHSRLVYSDPVGGSTTSSQTVSLRNTGNAPLVIPAGGVYLSGTAASQFHITSGPKVQTTVAPGSSVKVSVSFGATQLGPEGATLVVKSNATNGSTLNVTLRGLGTKGLQGANEPSLQWILDTYQIPVKVGDSTPAEGTLDDPPRTPNDEVVAQMFRKAGTGSVTITPIAVFSGEASPALTLGYYARTGTTLIAKKTLFTVPSADVQTVNPRVSGVTSFDPGTTTFGLFSTWAAQNNRTVYSEDYRNTFIASGHRRMFRVYPLKTAGGAVVANSYVIGNEEAFNHDYQDGVYIITNVKPAT